MMARAFIGIGSNLGDRQQHCARAQEGLARLPRTTLVRASPFIETDPQEGVAGGPFLNGVAEIQTELAPHVLLGHLQALEAATGRATPHPPGSARPIDLDILLYGDCLVSSPDLTIPHPRMAERRFVLEPLVAIAPEVRHPVLQVTAETLLRRLGATAWVDPEGVAR